MFFSFKHTAGLKPPTRPSQSIFDQGTTSITWLFKDLIYAKDQSKSTFIQIGWGQTKSKHIIFIVKKQTGRGREGRGSKMGTFQQIYFLNGPSISYIFQLFHFLFFRNCRDTHRSLSIFARNGRWGTFVGNVLCEKHFQQ